MQEDFHYYATYCAAYLAGFSHKESLDICYSAQLVDLCSKSFLSGIRAPEQAATTQLSMEMADARTDFVGIAEITRIWASFHFLPYDLYATKKHCTKQYLNKYRLICRPNSDLLVTTVNLAKDKSLQHIGIAMHVLADTWAHTYFAGTPSLVINNTDREFYEVLTVDGVETERQVKFRHNPTAADDIEKGIYTNSLYQGNENNIMNLGHGRAGHFPDYSFARYRYAPAWGDYEMVEKDNPSDYMKAFSQMVYALKYLRGEYEYFEKDTFDQEVLEKYGDRIKEILCKRQLIASEDWRKFGQELSGQEVEAFDIDKYQVEYEDAEEKDRENTALGKFITGAIAQKGMVTDQIYRSGNYIAGLSIRKRLSELQGIITGEEKKHDQVAKD